MTANENQGDGMGRANPEWDQGKRHVTVAQLGLELWTWEPPGGWVSEYLHGYMWREEPLGGEPPCWVLTPEYVARVESLRSDPNVEFHKC